MPQIWPVNKGRERYRRLLSFKADAATKVSLRFLALLQKTDILMLTGISTASELAKEKGSMIHLSRPPEGVGLTKEVQGRSASSVTCGRVVCVVLAKHVPKLLP
jgi:hypothetical protein